MQAPFVFHLPAVAVPEDINALDHEGHTALHRAVRENNKDGVLQLLKDGADVEVLTSDGWNCLHLAANQGHASLLPLLIRPSTLNQTTTYGACTPLRMAVEDHKLEAAAVLMAFGATLNPPGDPPDLLYLACESDAQDAPELPLLVLNALLADHSNAAAAAQAVHYRDGFNAYTALQWAAGGGCQELVAKLLEAGADRDAVDRHGETPLHWAADMNQAHLVPLLATPTNIDTVGEDGGTPLCKAAAEGFTTTVAALLAAGAHASTIGKAGWSALLAAALGGHTQVMELLLAALAKECGQQQQAQQQQEQACLTQLVAAAVVPLARPDGPVSRCCQLLTSVLDVLGPEVAAGVCHAVEQQLREEWEQAAGPQNWDPWRPLAEGLLLGWVVGEVWLHAARQPVLARLQRLVPAVGANQQGLDLQARKPPCSTREGQGPGLDGQLVGLLQQAALASAAGQAEEAGRLLRVFAAMHLQQQQQHTLPGTMPEQQALLAEVSTAVGAGITTPQRPWDQVPDIAVPLVHLVEAGHAASASIHYACQATSLHQQVCQATCWGHPLAYSALLAAWVGARRQLQQLPQELAAAVVAAVKAAQQQQQGQELGTTKSTQGQPGQLCGTMERVSGSAGPAYGL